MERDDEASSKDLRLLLQKEGVGFSLTSTSRHVIFATIFTPCVADQCANTRWSTPSWSTVGQPTTDRCRSVFYEKHCVYSTYVCRCVYILDYGGFPHSARSRVANVSFSYVHFHTLSKPEISVAIQVGAKIVVTAKVNDEWLEGLCGAKKGRFPSSFVDRVPDNLPAAAKEESKKPEPKPEPAKKV